MSPVMTIVGVAGAAVYVAYIALKRKDKNAHSPANEKNKLLHELKANADEYELDFDRCVFKDSSYVTEEEEENMDIAVAGLLVGSTVGFLNTPVVRENHTQSVLFFSDPSIHNGKRFFQTFYMDMTNLKYHVLSGHVKLLIDKNDTNRYFFDLNS